MEFSLKPHAFLAKKTNHFNLSHTYPDSVIAAGISYSDMKNYELKVFNAWLSTLYFILV